MASDLITDAAGGAGGAPGPAVGLEPYPRLRLRHRGRDRGRLLVGLVLAFPAAVALVLLALLISLIPEPPLNRGPQSVALVPVSGSDWSQNRAIRPDQQKTANAKAANQKSEPSPPPPDEEKKKPEPIPGQVVDVAPTPDNSVPENTDKVSEYNTKVAKEMQARDKTAFYKNAMPKHTTVDKPTELAGKDAANKVQAVGDPGVGHEKQAPTAKHPGQKMEIPDVRPREKLSLSRGARGELPNVSGAQEIKGNSNRLRLENGEGEAEAEHTVGNGGTQSHLNLNPSQSVLDRIAGAPANDHLEGIDEGEGTYLNTREWKYAGYFNRVKQRVGESWDPSTALRRRDPNGQMYGWRDRQTVLDVTLDKAGAVAELSVQKSSGVDFLDEEALEAFRRAQPFPNPPPGLLDTEGRVKFSFGFYLQLNSGGLQLFHHQAE